MTIFLGIASNKINIFLFNTAPNSTCEMLVPTVLPAKSAIDVMFCLQLYQGIRIDKSLVY